MLALIDKALDDMIYNSSYDPWKWTSVTKELIRTDRRIRSEIVDNQLKIEFDVPGVLPQDVNMIIDSSVIKVTAKGTKRNYEYLQAINSEIYDLDKVDAQIANGVLTIMIDKVEQKPSREKKIKIKY